MELPPLRRLSYKLGNYYNLWQTMAVMGFDFKMQEARWEASLPEPLPTLQICSKRFYPRLLIDQLAEEKIKDDFYSKLRFEKVKLKQIRYDVDIREWLPRCIILDSKLVDYSYETLYKISVRQQTSKLIRSKLVYGRYWFNVEDVYDFLVLGLGVREVVQRRQETDPEERLAFAKKQFDVRIKDGVMISK